MDLLSLCLVNETRRDCFTVRRLSAFVEIAAGGDSDS
jgi:hypothetical protein